MMQVLRIGTACATTLLLGACAGAVKPMPPAEISSPSTLLTTSVTSSAPMPVQGRILPGVTSFETGTAAWYGKELQGKKTADGEVFDMYGLTAAHRTLPLGTIILVTNLDNSKSVKVKITDRGPFTNTRVLDLSYGAARELGFVARGTARVSIEILKTAREPALYTVQAATFAEEENARQLKYRLSKKFEVVTIVPFETNVARFYRVRVGSYSSEELAEQVAKKLTFEGLEPIVVRKD